MPDIKPFRGWRYCVKNPKNFSAVYAPPYDVISKKDQEALYKLHPNNVIRLELGREEKGDTASDNKYTRARATMADWKKKGVLKQEKAPAFYVYVQDYREEGKAKTRFGFLSAMKIDEKAVLKHENTLSAPKKDRFSLIKQVKTNLSPIFGLFDDKSGKVQYYLKKALQSQPIVDATVAGVRHRLYAETRPEVTVAIRKAMKPFPMYIADGHHRFEVACQYRRFRRAKDGDGQWNYVMTYFSDCRHNPFKIFPTHRLVKSKNLARSLDAIAKLGSVEKASSLDGVLKRLEAYRQDVKGGDYTFGVYTKKGGFRLVTLAPKLKIKVKNNPVDRLDVAVLHKFLIEPCFGIFAVEKSDAIDFTRDPKEAKEKVDQGLFDAALLLRPTSLDEMLLASEKGLKMPQKSTYFYPKLLSGLVFHGVDKD